MPSSYHITIFSFFFFSQLQCYQVGLETSQSVSQSVPPACCFMQEFYPFLCVCVCESVCVSRASCVVVLLLLHWSHQIKNDASFNLIICILSLSLLLSLSVSNKSHLKLKTRARFSRHFAPVPSGSSSTGWNIHTAGCYSGQSLRCQAPTAEHNVM